VEGSNVGDREGKESRVGGASDSASMQPTRSVSEELNHVIKIHSPEILLRGF
jgi:hypothetical protein